jgi:hypothetical protein
LKLQAERSGAGLKFESHDEVAPEIRRGGLNLDEIPNSSADLESLGTAERGIET